MIRAASLLCLIALPLQAETVAEQAAKASVDLQQAVAALETATREATLTRAFDAKRDGIGRLLGVLATMEANPGPLLLLHPEGAVGSARSGMILADVTPALQSEALALKAELQELADLRTLQLSAGEVLTKGLATAQAARTELSKAISDRIDLPKRFTEDPDVLKGLLDSADTLDAFAAGLSPDAEAGTSFAEQRGRLSLPALGTLLRRPDEADAAGVRRPGLALATQPRALVTAPWPATIRYRGPLLDYGNVMILEPGDGYLLVLAGMETLYGEVGEVVAGDAPLGLMGGPSTASAEFMAGAADGSGGRGSETLYMELRQGAVPVDPIPWFAGLARTGD